MVNPFREFQTYQPRGRTLPLDRIIMARDAVLDQLVAGYQRLIGEEEHTLAGTVEIDALPHAYEVAEQIVAPLDFNEEDVEDFCFVLEGSTQDSSALWRLTGLYLSALCNRVEAAAITLRLARLPNRVHLLGYGLPAGKQLVVEGHCGDALGASLAGGEIVVQGSTANWAGMGLRQGKITIEGNAGEYTGEEMEGGEVYIGGRIRSLGQVKGGKVYLGTRLVAPVRETA